MEDGMAMKETGGGGVKVDICTYMAGSGTGFWF
jgi:hypothetical protein